MATIRDLCLSIGSGSTPSRKRPEFFIGDIPWLKTKELADATVFDTEENISTLALEKSSCKLFPAGAVVMAMYGATVGKLGLLGRKMTTNQACCAMVTNPDLLDNRYLFYWLKRNRREIHDLSNGAAQQNLSVRIIGAIEIEPPPVGKQVRISRVLGSLDDKIAANEKAIRASTALAESLVAGSLLDKESKLGDIAAITMGTSPKGEFLSEEQLDLPFYQGVRDFGFLRPNHRIFTDHPVREADTGDILFAVRAPVGEVNIATERTAIGRGLAAIRGIENHVALFYLLRSRPDLWNSHQDSGTVFASINKTDLAAALVPSIAMSETEERSLRVLHEHSLATVEENRVLAKTRDELLPLLMNGKISVREAEQEATSAGADIPSEEIGA